MNMMHNMIIHEIDRYIRGNPSESNRTFCCSFSHCWFRALTSSGWRLAVLTWNTNHILLRTFCWPISTTKTKKRFLRDRIKRTAYSSTGSSIGTVISSIDSAAAAAEDDDDDVSNDALPTTAHHRRTCIIIIIPQSGPTGTSIIIIIPIHHERFISCHGQ